MTDDNKKCPKSFRFDDTTLDMLTKLKDRLGVSQADVVRFSIRKLFEFEIASKDSDKSAKV